MTRYEAHGLGIASEVALDARPLPADRRIDLTIALRGPSPIARAVPPGRVVARVGSAEDGFALVEDPQGFVARFAGVADYRVSHGLDAVSVTVDRDVEAEWGVILLAGNVLALLAELRGSSMLHASAVDVDGACIALVGGPGSGKSALAALLCDRGARLVSDDALCIEVEGRGVCCQAGVGPLRLRSADGPLPYAGLPLVGTSTDGRALRRATLTTRHRPRLAAVVLPRLSRETETVTATRTPRLRAIHELIRHPRVHGWTDVEPTRRFFSDVAALTERVAVFEIAVPWRQSLEGSVVERVVEELQAIATHGE